MMGKRNLISALNPKRSFAPKRNVNSKHFKKEVVRLLYSEQNIYKSYDNLKHNNIICTQIHPIQIHYFFLFLEKIAEHVILNELDFQVYHRETFTR